MMETTMAVCPIRYVGFKPINCRSSVFIHHVTFLRSSERGVKKGTRQMEEEGGASCKCNGHFGSVLWSRGERFEKVLVQIYGRQVLQRPAQDSRYHARLSITMELEDSPIILVGFH